MKSFSNGFIWANSLCERWTLCTAKILFFGNENNGYLNVQVPKLQSTYVLENWNIRRHLKQIIIITKYKYQSKQPSSKNHVVWRYVSRYSLPEYSLYMTYAGDVLWKEPKHLAAAELLVFMGMIAIKIRTYSKGCMQENHITDERIGVIRRREKSPRVIGRDSRKLWEIKR